MASRIEHGVSQFSRAPSGALTGEGCIKDTDAVGSFQNCPATTDGLASTSDVAITPNGAAVFATGAFNDHALVGFDRDLGP